MTFEKRALLLSRTNTRDARCDYAEERYQGRFVCVVSARRGHESHVEEVQGGTRRQPVSAMAPPLLPPPLTSPACPVTLEPGLLFPWSTATRSPPRAPRSSPSPPPRRAILRRISTSTATSAGRTPRRRCSNKATSPPSSSHREASLRASSPHPLSSHLLILSASPSPPSAFTHAASLLLRVRARLPPLSSLDPPSPLSPPSSPLPQPSPRPLSDPPDRPGSSTSESLHSYDVSCERELM